MGNESQPGQFEENLVEKTGSNGRMRTNSCKDDPKQVHGHLPPNPVGNGIEEDHADELAK
jgi:hypothetical protein